MVGTLVWATLVVGSCCRCGVAQDTNQHGRIIRAERAYPPTTLAEMFAQVDAVVRVEVTGASAAKYDQQPGLVRDVTDYAMRVLEVFKSHGSDTSVGGTILVRRDGPPDAIEEGFSAFKAGTQYVLFLRWSQTNRTYVPVWGPEGTVEIRGPMVVSEGERTLAMRAKGKETARFLLELRSSSPSK